MKQFGYIRISDRITARLRNASSEPNMVSTTMTSSKLFPAQVLQHIAMYFPVLSFVIRPTDEEGSSQLK